MVNWATPSLSVLICCSCCHEFRFLSSVVTVHLHACSVPSCCPANLFIHLLWKIVHQYTWRHSWACFGIRCHLTTYFLTYLLTYFTRTAQSTQPPASHPTVQLTLLQTSSFVIIFSLFLSRSLELIDSELYFCHFTTLHIYNSVSLSLPA